MKNPFAVLCLLLLAFSQKSLAWGLTGHRVTGEIASYYLEPRAREAISRILGNESLAMAANWMDFIRSDSNYSHLDTWHYMNFPPGLDYPRFLEALDKDSGINAHNRILFLVNELKSGRLKNDESRYYLRLLIHLVGDIHQPLHISPEGSRGGNDIRVRWFGQSTNLHTVWDTHLVDHQKLSYTEYARAINFTTAGEREAWQKEPLSAWLFESYSIAGLLHGEIREKNPRLGYEYNFRHIDRLNLRLLKAGVRLAGLLNSIFS